MRIIDSFVVELVFELESIVEYGSAEMQEALNVGYGARLATERE